mgnify:CR=1 FL=1
MLCPSRSTSVALWRSFPRALVVPDVTTEPKAVSQGYECQAEQKGKSPSAFTIPRSDVTAFSGMELLLSTDLKKIHFSQSYGAITDYFYKGCRMEDGTNTSK